MINDVTAVAMLGKDHSLLRVLGDLETNPTINIIALRLAVIPC